MRFEDLRISGFEDLEMREPSSPEILRSSNPDIS
jgi:hypothetical protein